MNEIMEMKTDMVSKLASMLIANNLSSSIEEALNIVINSNTYNKLMDDKTQLYHQSSRYVYSFLVEELENK